MSITSGVEIGLAQADMLASALLRRELDDQSWAKEAIYMNTFYSDNSALELH